VGRPKGNQRVTPKIGINLEREKINSRDGIRWRTLPKVIIDIIDKCTKVVGDYEFDSDAEKYLKNTNRK
jgi:hypothetical protein